jgi:hypothetical protein
MDEQAQQLSDSFVLLAEMTVEPDNVKIKLFLTEIQNLKKCRSVTRVHFRPV